MEVEEYTKRQKAAALVKGNDVVVSRADIEHLIIMLSAVNQSGMIHCVNDSYHLIGRLERDIKESEAN